MVEAMCFEVGAWRSVPLFYTRLSAKTEIGVEEYLSSSDITLPKKGDRRVQSMEIPCEIFPRVITIFKS
jgi:hypothetical protein